MKQTIYNIWSKFLTVFGDIRISNFFPWLYYDTTEFKIKGNDIQYIMSILQTGDVILRGYSNYIDGKFIPNPEEQEKLIGKGWSHGAVYIGNNEIIHAVSPTVERIHVIDFCQCDRICILRLINGAEILTEEAIKRAESFLDVPYDFFFTTPEDNKDEYPSALYCFELVKYCYPTLDINKIEVSKLGGLLRAKTYLPLSFLQSGKFQIIYNNNEEN